MKDLRLSDDELISIIPKNKIFIMYFLCIFLVIVFIQSLVYYLIIFTFRFFPSKSFRFYRTFSCRRTYFSGCVFYR